MFKKKKDHSQANFMDDKMASYQAENDDSYWSVCFRAQRSISLCTSQLCVHVLKELYVLGIDVT